MNPIVGERASLMQGTNTSIFNIQNNEKTNKTRAYSYYSSS